jgi:hypothetical protein
MSRRPRRIVDSEDDDDDDDPAPQKAKQSQPYRIKKRAIAVGARSARSMHEEEDDEDDEDDDEMDGLECGNIIGSASKRSKRSTRGALYAADDYANEEEDEVVEVQYAVAQSRSGGADAPIELDDDDAAAAVADGERVSDEEEGCTTCGLPGELLCCDGPGCEAQHHLHCVGLTSVPAGDWLCPACAVSTSGAASADGKSKARSRKILTDAQLSSAAQTAMAAERLRQRQLQLHASPSKASAGGASADVGGSASVGGVEEADEADDGALVLNAAEAACDARLAVSVSAAIARRMKPHQRDGCRFLFANVVVSVAALRDGSRGLGALLAHSMGLGKTLTTLAFIDALLCSKVLRAAATAAAQSPLRTVLVVAPATVLDNWCDEMDKWCAQATCASAPIGHGTARTTAHTAARTTARRTTAHTAARNTARRTTAHTAARNTARRTTTHDAARNTARRTTGRRSRRRLLPGQIGRVAQAQAGHAARVASRRRRVHHRSETMIQPHHP